MKPNAHYILINLLIKSYPFPGGENQTMASHYQHFTLKFDEAKAKRKQVLDELRNELLKQPLTKESVSEFFEYCHKIDEAILK